MDSFNGPAEQQGSVSCPNELQLPLVRVAGYFRQPLLAQMCFKLPNKGAPQLS